jgi:hypothetical protein
MVFKIKANMRLHHLEHQQTLSDHTQRTVSDKPLSNSDTKQNIEQWYKAAFQTAQTPYWIADGVITDWQASLNDWFSSIKAPKLQLLDSKWLRYVTQLHYIHYLKSQQSHLDTRAAELDEQRANVKLLLANAEQQAEQILSGKKTTRRPKP